MSKVQFKRNVFVDGFNFRVTIEEDQSLVGFKESKGIYEPVIDVYLSTTQDGQIYSKRFKSDQLNENRFIKVTKETIREYLDAQYETQVAKNFWNWDGNAKIDKINEDIQYIEKVFKVNKVWHIDSGMDFTDIIEIDLNKGEGKPVTKVMHTEGEHTYLIVIVSHILELIIKHKPSQISFDKMGKNISLYNSFMDRVKKDKRLQITDNGVITYN